MGFFNKLLGGGSTSKQDSGPALDVELDDISNNETVFGTFRGEQVLFETTSSPDGTWTCLYARSGFTDGSPVALAHSGEVQSVTVVGQAEDAAVSNTGVAAITDTAEADQGTLLGTLLVVNSKGEVLTEHEFDSLNFHCAISDDGKYASTATSNPDRSVYIIDSESERVGSETETPDLNGPQQEFDYLDGERVLYLLDQDCRYRAVDLMGETVWRSAELEAQERIEDLLDRGARGICKRRWNSSTRGTSQQMMNTNGNRSLSGSPTRTGSSRTRSGVPPEGGERGDCTGALGEHRGTGGGI